MPAQIAFRTTRQRVWQCYARVPGQSSTSEVPGWSHLAPCRTQGLSSEKTEALEALRIGGMPEGLEIENLGGLSLTEEGAVPHQQSSLAFTMWKSHTCRVLVRDLPFLSAAHTTEVLNLRASRLFTKPPPGESVTRLIVACIQVKARRAFTSILPVFMTSACSRCWREEGIRIFSEHRGNSSGDQV